MLHKQQTVILWTVVVLIQIVIRIQKFLMELLPLQDRVNVTNFSKIAGLGTGLHSASVLVVHKLAAKLSSSSTGSITENNGKLVRKIEFA